MVRFILMRVENETAPIRRKMEGGEMRVGIMIDDEVDGLHVMVGSSADRSR